ncbi:MAG: PfkB family carbohydrate kinase, partial [Clostridia bacterium]|nr:PfkB family carbohydrate kinase [Clostridia bacterium]
ISETELELLTGECDPETGGRLLLEKGIRLVLVTLGPHGCFYLSSAGSVYLPTYDTRVVDTTGAGDAFLGAALFHISRLEKPLEEISREEMERIVDFANAAGALCASKRGGIPAMPTCEEVANCLLHVPKLII